MKNMTIRVKLIVGFSIMLALILLVSVLGIVGLTKMEAGSKNLYEKNTIPVMAMGDIMTALEKQRVTLRDANLAKDDPAKLEAAQNALAAEEEDLARNVAILALTAKAHPEQSVLFDQIDKSYEQDYAASKTAMLDALVAGDDAAFSKAIVAGGIVSHDIEVNMKKLNDLVLAEAKETSDENIALGTTLTWILIASMLFSLVLAVLLTYYIATLIAKPLRQMVAVAEELSLGNVEADFQPANRDEVGKLADAFHRMVEAVREQAKVVSGMAGGDLSMTVLPRSDKDIMNIGLRDMLQTNNEVFSEIIHGADNVSSGAKQVADGSQSLAQATTEQAAVVEELSSSISEISDKTVKNASMAQEASTLGQKINANAQKGSTQMDHMMQAVKEINEASQSINKVIKVIDDIAFQTNILALNAAVEAARAGQHGKGFAVVAEEVRSLAAKSAEAAKDTGSLIANSIEKAELGSRIAQETAQSLAEIVEGIQQSSAIVADIARLSDEQAAAIMQINKGIDQVSQVVQSNSATAEESAAASEEMSGQSSMLSDLVSRFKLKDNPMLGSARARGALPRSAHSSERSFENDRISYVPAVEGGYGKY